MKSDNDDKISICATVKSAKTGKRKLKIIRNDETTLINFDDLENEDNRKILNEIKNNLDFNKLNIQIINKSDNNIIFYKISDDKISMSFSENVLKENVYLSRYIRNIFISYYTYMEKNFPNKLFNKKIHEIKNDETYKKEAFNNCKYFYTPAGVAFAAILGLTLRVNETAGFIHFLGGWPMILSSFGVLASVSTIASFSPVLITKPHDINNVKRDKKHAILEKEKMKDAITQINQVIKEYETYEIKAEADKVLDRMGLNTSKTEVSTRKNDSIHKISNKEEIEKLKKLKEIASLFVEKIDDEEIDNKHSKR